jgi:hypothetical protein
MPSPASLLRKADKSFSREGDAEAERAMSWLKQAVAAGDKDLSKIGSDKDLDTLRTRDDFKKLVAELESTKPKSP